MNKFVSIMEEITEDYSKRNASLLDGDNLDYLVAKEIDNEDDHSTQEEGFQHYKKNLEKLPSGKIKPGRLVEVNPRGKVTLSEGQVDHIFALRSKSNTLHQITLTELTQMRMEARANPAGANYQSYEEWLALRTSCWIVEHRGRNFHCDCPVGIRGKLHKHSMALAYSKLDYPVLDTLGPTKLNNIRRGWVGLPKLDLLW